MAGSLTQITKPIVFKNGYVVSLDTNVGWNQSPSRLTLNLVDVPAQDFGNSAAIADVTTASSDGYQPPEVGSFVKFNLKEVMDFQGASGVTTPFKFDGIVMSHELPVKTDSANIKQTVLHDTREVINNIPVIISNVARDVKLPQAINAFSWWDVWWPFVGKLNVSNSNDFGIQWEKIRDAINGKPLGTQHLNDAALPVFAEYSPNFESDGFYFNVNTIGYVGDRDHDKNSSITYNNKVKDSVTDTSSVTNKKVEALPPHDWIFGSVIPSGNLHGPIRYQQPYTNQFRMTVRNRGRASGAIIHMDTGYEVNMLTSTTSGIINPVIFNFYGTRYKINLDNIPIQDPAFRIKGDIIYLGELIDRAANYGQFDWFVKDVIDDAGIKQINIQTVDRRRKLEFDEQAINQWLDTFVDANGTRVIKYSKGRELRSESTMMVLFGAKQEQLTQKTVAGQWYGIHKTSNVLTQNPFTAIANNNAIIAGAMSGPRLNCAIDFGHLNLPFLSDSYNFDEITMRAALYDPQPFGSLFNYLAHIYHPIIADLERGLGVDKPGASILFTGTQRAFIDQYRLADRDSIAYRKLIQGVTNYGNRALDILEMVGTTIARHAEEYWGRQFIIKFSDSMLINWDITNTAYQGFAYNEGTAFFRDRDGIKVRGFVVFKKVNPFLIKTDLTERDMYLVKNSDLILDGSKVINYLVYGNSSNYDLYVAADYEVVDNRFVIAKIASPVKWSNPDLVYGQQLAKLQEYVRLHEFSSETQKFLLGSIGTDIEHQCIYPQYAYIPLVAKNDRYGPWASEGLEIDQNAVQGTDENGVALTRKSSIYKVKSGYDGKLEILSDDDLAPWIMGGLATDPFLGMNNAANARVANASSNLVKPISADITVEGLPTQNIGDEITQGTSNSGANISDISLSLNENQVVTRYVVKNFAAKQRDYRSEDFKMGSVLSVRSSNVQSNIPGLFSGIINKMPSNIASRTRAQIRADKRTNDWHKRQMEEPPARKKAGIIGKNYSRVMDVSPEKIAGADNSTNHAQIGYANQEASSIVATVGSNIATINVPGKTSSAKTQMDAALK